MIWLLWGCTGGVEEESATISVVVETVRQEDLSERILTSGILQAGQWQALYFQQAGNVTVVDVGEGETVRRGQRLATLDTAWQENQVAVSQLQLDTSKLELAQSTHRREQSEAMLRSAAISPEQVREAEHREAESQGRVEQNALNLNGQKIRLSQMRLFAPFDGVIAEVNIRVGDQVRGSVADPDAELNSRPPMLILQPGQYELRTSLPEGQALRVREGTAAIVSLMEAPEVAMPGSVVWMAPSVDRDSRTVAFRVVVDSGTVDPTARGGIRDGSTVRVELHAAARADATTVSETALAYHAGQAYAFRVVGDQVSRVAVEPGTRRGARVELLDGLSPGDIVVSDQVYLLEDGQTVQVVE